MDSTVNNREEQTFSEGLLQYLNDSPTAYHAVENAAYLLREHGFQELLEKEAWALEKGGKYFIRKNHSGIIAFSIGSADLAQNGLRIIGAHTDSPSFKIKPGACAVTGDGYVKLNTEVYGGALLSAWFDRPLSIAGRVMVQEAGAAVEKLLRIDRPVLLIPNLCIHFQRDANENCSYNKQKDVFPLLCMEKDGVGKGDYLRNLLAGALRTDKAAIIDYELFLYEHDRGSFVGGQNEFISASRIDNLSMVYTGLQGLIASQSVDGAGKNTKMLAAFDNEEVGSASAQGADSAFLPYTIKRICKNLGLSEDQYFQALANSTSISADTAHAVHPNYSDKHDPENRPVLGGGPVIKYSASQKYATTAVSAAYFIQACREAGAPYQRFVNRNDITGGSTIGPALSRVTTIPTVDMGTPILAMHSVREFGCVIDNIYTRRVFQAYYGMEI